MSERYHPDCDVRMEQTTVTAQGGGDVYIEGGGGPVDRLGVGYQIPLSAVLRPERGMARLSADLSE